MDFQINRPKTKKISIKERERRAKLTRQQSNLENDILITPMSREMHMTKRKPIKKPFLL